MLRRLLLTTVAVSALAQTAGAQTAADTASVILDVARSLERTGKIDAARELFRYLQSRYGTTPAARAADSLTRALPRIAAVGTGRTGFVTFNTLYGAFLGLAIPAAFNSNEAGTFGVGLLVGAPVGFFASRSFATKHFRSAGQAGVASFATVWGTWQGLGLQRILNVGDRRACFATGGPVPACFTEESDTAPWAAMVVGGLAGLGVGWALASAKDVVPGTATLVSNSAFWGTWYGAAVGRIVNLHDDGLFAAALIVGNAALLVALPAARAWHPTPSRVRLITAAGLAGGLAGLGIDLIAGTDDPRVNLAIPAAASALGLVIAAASTRDRRDLDGPGGDEARANALIQWRNGLELSLAVPEPTSFQQIDRTGKLRVRPGARLRLFDARF